MAAEALPGAERYGPCVGPRQGSRLCQPAVSGDRRGGRPVRRLPAGALEPRGAPASGHPGGGFLARPVTFQLATRLGMGVHIASLSFTSDRRPGPDSPPDWDPELAIRG